MPNAEKPKAKAPKPKGQGPNIWMQLAIAFVVFLVLSIGYSLVREYIADDTESVPLSQIATDIAAGLQAFLNDSTRNRTGTTAANFTGLTGRIGSAIVARRNELRPSALRGSRPGQGKHEAQLVMPHQGRHDV